MVQTSFDIQDWETAAGAAAILSQGNLAAEKVPVHAASRLNPI
jgi:hypothetical protein